MPSEADPCYDREHAGANVLAHRAAFIRHSQAFGMKLCMPHAACTTLDQTINDRRSPFAALILAICATPYVLATTGSSSSSREAPIHGPRPHAYLEELMVPEVGVEMPSQVIELQCAAAGLRPKVPPAHTPLVSATLSCYPQF